MKSLWYFEDADPWGHSVKKLIDDLEEVNIAVYNIFSKATRSALLLDRFYIPTRYPNGLPDITPDMAFIEEDSAESIDAACIIVKLVQEYLNI